MFYAQRPVSLFDFPSQQPYSDRPIMSTEQYYGQLAAEHHRRAQRALQLAQQEREQAIRCHQLQAIEHRRELARREAPIYQQERGRREVASRLQQLHDGRPRSMYLGPPSRARSGSYGCQYHPEYQPRPRSWHPELVRSLQESEDHGYEALLSQFLRAMANDEPKEQAAHATPVAPADRKVHLHQLSGSEKQDKGKGKAPAAPEDTPKPTQGDFISSIMELFGGDHQQETSIRRLGVLSPQPTYTAPAREGVAGSSGIRQKPVQVKPQPRPQVPAQVALPPSTPSTPSSIHSHSFSSLDNIESRFAGLKANFMFPSHLDFEPSSQALQYTSQNAPVRQYESDLTKLLTELDAVDSDGTESIRGARKAIVKAIEAELDRVDGLKAEAWAQAKEGLRQSATAAEETLAVVSTPEMTTVSPEAVEEVAVYTTPIDDAEALSTVAVSTSPSASASEPLPASAHDFKHHEDGADLHQSDDGQLTDAAVSEDVTPHFEDTLALGPDVEYADSVIVDNPVLPEVAQAAEPAVQQVLPVEPEARSEATTAEEVAITPPSSGEPSLEDMTGPPAIEEVAHSGDSAISYPDRSSPQVAIEDSAVVLSDAEASSTDDEQQLSDEGSSVEFVSDGESNSGGDGFEML